MSAMTCWLGANCRGGGQAEKVKDDAHASGGSGLSEGQSHRGLLRLIVCLQHALGRLSTPNSDQIRLRPFEVELLRPHQNQWLAFVMCGEEKSARFGFNQNLAFLEGDFEHWRI